MRWRPRTLRARLTAWYAICLAVPLVALTGVAYVAFERVLVAQVDEFIGSALSAFEIELGAERRFRADLDAALGATIREMRFRGLEIVILDAQDRLVAVSEPMRGSAVPAAAPALLSELRQHRRDRAAFTAGHDAGQYRLITRPFDAFRPGHLIGGAYSLQEVAATLSALRTTLAFAVPLLVIAAATGGYLIARRSLAPVAAIGDRAAEISARTLHERLPVVSDDELGRLGRVLNALLDRLEASFEQQRRFMADASHELRTPTAVIRTEVDVTLSRPHREEQEYRDSAAVVRNAAQRLTRVVDDLLFAARADAGEVVLQTRNVDLADVVAQSIEVLQPEAHRRGVALACHAPSRAPMHGDPDLLGRVFLNLVDNAIRHARSDVRVELSPADGTWRTSVCDDGPGIPQEDWERIFERFVRLDRARTSSGSGVSGGAAGLGLGIARRVAVLHGGTVRVADSAPGRTEFVVRLPSGPNGLLTS